MFRSMARFGPVTFDVMWGPGQRLPLDAGMVVACGAVTLEISLSTWFVARYLELWFRHEGRRRDAFGVAFMWLKIIVSRAPERHEGEECWVLEGVDNDYAQWCDYMEKLLTGRGEDG